MDPLNRRNLINWLKLSDKTLLLCTHDLDIVLEVCDRCLLLVDGSIKVEGPVSKILFDRKLLEENKLEMPLALMTHELLHDILAEQDMDEEHRHIIGKFLHAHRHAHGTDAHIHVHLHAHEHMHEHLHEKVDESHFHESSEHHHEKADIDNIAVPHSHGKDGHHHRHDHGHDHEGDHDHLRGHYHDHDQEEVVKKS
jgi:ABC-type multidrug transport system ATPase subunit